MPRTPADNAAQYRYNAAHLKRIPLDVRREDYERIKAAADQEGLPVNTWIKRLIYRELALQAFRVD